MKPNAIKVKLVLCLSVPLIALGFTALYSALDWLLVEQTGWISLDVEVVDLWIPGALAAVLAVTLVSPRISLLKLNEARNIPFLFTVVAIATIAIPAVIAQLYIHAATGELVHVASADAIASEPRAKFYSADRICLDRNHAAAIPVIEPVGRNNENLSIALYLAVPLCSGGDVRIGINYQQTIGNRLSDSEKGAQYRAFLKRSDAQFGAEDSSRYTYLERIGPSAALRNFNKALAKDGIAGSPILLVPHTDPFDQRAGDKLAWMARALAIGSLLWLAMVLIAPVDRRKLTHPEMIEKREEKEKILLRLFLVPSRKYWSLPLLLDANLLVYLAMVLSGAGVASFQTDDLIAWGGNYGPADHGLGLLRLFTSQFVHGGLWHIANNLYGLFFAGLFLAPVAANARLVFAYLLCGLGGSVASLFVRPVTVRVGASGSIFGLFGILLALTAFGDKRLAGARQMIIMSPSPCWRWGWHSESVPSCLIAEKPGRPNAAHAPAAALRVRPCGWGLR